MALRIRRGTDAQRTGKTFEMGEIVYTTDAQQVWIGNGITAGGVPVVGSNVAGYGIVYNNVTHKLDVSGLTSDDVTQGINNKYFSTELAVDAVGAALVAGNSTNVGITFTYAQTQDDAGRINATVALDGVGLTDIVNDTTPQLGGDLDLNSFNISGIGSIGVSGNLVVSSTSLATTDASSTSGVSTVSFAAQSDPPFTVGETIYITGVTPAGFNGTKVVTACTTTSVSFVGTTVGPQTVAGTITGGGRITASNYGTVNAKKVYITDNTDSGIVNAGFVITSSRAPADGDNWFTFNSHHNVGGDFHAMTFNRTRGTSAAPTVLQDQDFIFALTFSGRTTDGSTAAAASVASFVTGSPGAGILPGSLALATADATGLVGPKLIVGPDGQQTIFAPALTAGSGSGEVNTSTISSWMKVTFNGVDYAVPMYAINP